MPMIGHINGGYIIDVDFREGNVAPVSKNLEFIKQCEAQLPKGKKFSRLRAEGASYQAEIFNTITKKTSYNFHTFITFTTFTKTYK